MNIGKQVAKGKFIKTGFNKDALVRHGIILGATGSGKTGLGIGLLEQLALDGVPIIAIDPKGDLGNILDVPLMGKELNEKDIQRRANLKSVDASIYTPGLSEGGGKKLGIYGSSKESRSEYLKQVLSLAYGYEVGSLATQYVFLEESIGAVEKYRSLYDFSIAYLIGYAMQPVIKSVGGMALDDYISENERMTLARKLTSLSASKDFQRWSEGELDINKLFVDPSRPGNVVSQDKNTAWCICPPRLSIISIAHLSEQDRKFFLPIFLSELVNTMRSWQGTDKLRAVLYIDECVGMVPSVSNPPTKQWLMTLLKQARAYGLGVILATQNPADLDYKALGNVGSWWVGRLQTDLDRKKVEQAVRGSESGVNLGNMLGELEPRQFVQSVLGGEPVLVKSNNCLSRLSGPMTLQRIEAVMEWRSCRRAGAIEYRAGENEYSLYRRMIVAGAKCAVNGMYYEIQDVKEIEDGNLRKFLWEESVKPTLKKRLRMVQDDLMQGYLKDAKRQITFNKMRVVG